MSYKSNRLLTDAGAMPVPQYYNPTIDSYETIQGANGAPRSLIYDVNGNPLFTSTNGGYIQSADGKIVSMGATTDSPVTNPTSSASQIALLKGLLAQLQGSGTGSLPVQLTGSNNQVTVSNWPTVNGTQQVVFQPGVSASGNGTAVSVRGYKTLVIEIFGANSPAGIVNFQAASVSGVFAPVTGVNLNGFAQATSTSSISTTPTLWQFDVSALDSFQCPVTWTAGTITVQGRLIV